MPIIRQRMPVRDAVTEAETGLITRPWRTFLRDRDTALSNTPVRVAAVELPTQAAAIPATPFPADLTAGLYRVMVYARRIRVATTSSSLGVTIYWRESGVPLSLTTGVNASNTLTAVANAAWLIRIDPYTTIDYETTYASVGATPMLYRLDITVEQVKV